MASGFLLDDSIEFIWYSVLYTRFYQKSIDSWIYQSFDVSWFITSETKQTQTQSTSPLVAFSLNFSLSCYRPVVDPYGPMISQKNRLTGCCDSFILAADWSTSPSCQIIHSCHSLYFSSIYRKPIFYVIKLSKRSLFYLVQLVSRGPSRDEHRRSLTCGFLGQTFYFFKIEIEFLFFSFCFY